MFYGYESALEEPYLSKPEGVFHGFVSKLKADLIARKIPLGGVRQEYLEFARTMNLLANDVENYWRFYIRPWFDNKRTELERIDENTRTFFETHAISYIEVEGGKRRYPLIGRIDELDTTNRRIIERTILNPTGNRCPAMKDLQVWLYWKLLCSIPREKRPDIWRDENFEDYELVVETPSTIPVIVGKDDPRFPPVIHDAYTWIHDLTSKWYGSTVRDVYREGKELCEKVPFECFFRHRSCKIKSRHFPEAREAMHARIRELYRCLLHEQMWTHHLFLYQLLELPEQELRLIRGRVKQLEKNGTLTVELNNAEVLTEMGEEEDIYGLEAIFGTPKLGLVRHVGIGRQEGNTLQVRLRGREYPIPKTISFLPPRLSMYQEQPWFLYQVRQRRMRGFERWGVDKEHEARKSIPIQFVEASFGTKNLLARKRKDGL